MSPVEPTRPPAHCRSCDAGIRWSRTPAGKSIPLDWRPNRAGNVELRGQHDAAFVLVGAELELARMKVDAGETELYMPHHATCPDGRLWKR